MWLHFEITNLGTLQAPHLTESDGTSTLRGVSVRIAPRPRRLSSREARGLLEAALAKLDGVTVAGEDVHIDAAHLVHAYALGPRVGAPSIPSIRCRLDVEIEEIVGVGASRYSAVGTVDIEKGSSLTEDVPVELYESLAKLRADHADPTSVIFLMMKFRTASPYADLVQAVRGAAAPFGITVVRADDREYHPDLYWNILTYIYGCRYGIAVFDRVEAEVFNPNVSFEVGYMLALRRPVLLLKDRSFPSLHTELMGKLYRTFDPFSVGVSVAASVSSWLLDQGIHTSH